MSCSRYAPMWPRTMSHWTSWKANVSMSSRGITRTGGSLRRIWPKKRVGCHRNTWWTRCGTHITSKRNYTRKSISCQYLKVSVSILHNIYIKLYMFLNHNRARSWRENSRPEIYQETGTQANARRIYHRVRMQSRGRTSTPDHLVPTNSHYQGFTRLPDVLRWR